MRGSRLVSIRTRTDKRRDVQLLGVRSAERDPNALEHRDVAIPKPSRQEGKHTCRVCIRLEHVQRVRSVGHAAL